jgi:BON domain-containing protein
VNSSTCLVTTILVCVVFVGSACTDQAVDDTKRTTGAALDATRKGADKAIDATKDAADKTKEIAGKTAGKTREIVGEVAQKSQQVASATGETVTDAWITTKVKAKFADEKLLEGSDIHVDTNDRVITLAGTVLSRHRGPFDGMSSVTSPLPANHLWSGSCDSSPRGYV